MHNPPHPGEVPAEYLEGVSLVDAAAKIGVDQDSLDRLLGGKSSIDVPMSTKLGRALGTSTELWLGLQSAHDLD